MSEQIKEILDFDGDVKFTGKDLDIAWAYLQIKKLLELGTAGIDVYNFRAKVIEQYVINKTAGIAEASDAVVRSLPGKLVLGMPKGIDQPVFLKRWTLDDMFKDHVITNDRNVSIPTNVFESISGESAGEIVNGYWTATKNSNTSPDKLLGLSASGGELQLDDKGSISSITSWVLHWKAFTQYLPRKILFIKGDSDPKFTITALSQKRNVLLDNGSKVDKVAFLTSANVYNFFQVPFGKSWNDYSWKTVDFYLAREGQDVRFFMDNNEGEGPLECPQEIPGSLPTLINMNEKSSPVTFSGSAYSTISDVWISDGTTNGDSLPFLPKPAARFQFASDLNLTDSYFNYSNFFQDKFGGFAQIYGIDKAGDLLAGSPGNQTHWTTAKTQDGTLHGYQPRDRCLELKKGYQYMGIENFNFNTNFTVSFWVRSGSAAPLLKCVNGTNEFSFERRWDKEAFDVKLNGTLKSRLWMTGLTQTSLSNNWHHVTIVKNKNVLGFWTNGNFTGWLTLTDQEISDMGYAKLQFFGDTSFPVYLSDVRVFGYALSNIPANDFGKRTSYDFIDGLKQRLDS